MDDDDLFEDASDLWDFFPNVGVWVFILACIGGLVWLCVSQ